MAKKITKPDITSDAPFIKPFTKWLQKTVPQIGTVIGLEKFTTGQSNPTFKLQTIDSGKEDRFVLRTQPLGLLVMTLPSLG